MKQTNDVRMDGEAELCPSFAVTVDNLMSMSDSRQRADECRICELSLAADAIVREVRELLDSGMRMPEIGMLLSEVLRLPPTPLGEGTLTECMAPLRFREGLCRRADEITLAELLCRKARGAGLPSHPTAFLPTEEKRCEVAMVRSIYTEEALDVFCQERTVLRPLEVATVADAVECMLRGDAGYCLLPFATESGTRPSALIRPICADDVRIVAVTPVFGPDGLARMSYALLALSFDPVSVEEEDDLYLECMLPHGGERTAVDLLLAAQGLGAEVYRTDTFSYETEGEEQVLSSLVLRGRAHEITACLWYLSLFASEVTPVGLYKNLE